MACYRRRDRDRPRRRRARLDRGFTGGFVGGPSAAVVALAAATIPARASDPPVSATSFTWMKWRPRPPRIESDLRRCFEQPEAVSAGPAPAGRSPRCVAGCRCGSTNCAGLTIIALEAWRLVLRRRDAGAALAEEPSREQATAAAV
jgi:hypothetical protein